MCLRLLFCLLFVLVCPGSLLAAESPRTGTPTAATLYPSGGSLTETLAVELAQGENELAIALPLQARTETLRLAVSGAAGDGAEVTGLAFGMDQPVDQGRLKELTDKLTELEDAGRELALRLENVAAQRTYWRETRPKELAPAGYQELAAILSRELSRLAGEELEVNTATRALQAEQARIREEIKRVGQGAAERRVARVRLLAPRSGQAVLTYSYVLSGCGWSPRYRLNAEPGEKRVGLDFMAEAYQSTGRDWADVELSLATRSRGFRLTPPELPGWIIRERPKPMARAAGGAVNFAMEEAAMDAAPMKSKALAAPSAPPAPEIELRGTYALWTLGQRSLRAGDPSRVTLSEETYPADYLYLTRPSISPAAFLQASLELAEAVQYPAGEAVYQVDGEVVATGSFEMEGRERKISFGTDPLVSCSMDLLEKKGGETGFLSSKQSGLWKWRLTAANAKPHPVTLRVEEPRPQPRRDEIKLELSSDPAPDTLSEEDERKHVLVWTLDLAPGQEQTISHEVTLTAPEEMELLMGR